VLPDSLHGGLPVRRRGSDPMPISAAVRNGNALLDMSAEVTEASGSRERGP
jgi:hypothetical protein